MQTRQEPRLHSSYRGELDAHPENLPLQEGDAHTFHADAPGRLVGTVVTEFRHSDSKVYLSPVIDCHDGRPIP